MIEVKICIAAYDEKNAWAIFSSHTEVHDDIRHSSHHIDDFMGTDERGNHFRAPSDGVWMFDGKRGWASGWSGESGGDPNGDEPIYRGTFRRLTDVELGALGSGENPCDPCGV